MLDCIVIIGNGFDLAHGMETKYFNFHTYLTSQVLEDPNSYKELINHVKLMNYSEKGENHIPNEFWNGSFLQKLDRDFKEKNWCDIELEYFNELKKIGSKGLAIDELNRVFKKLKEELDVYMQLRTQNTIKHNYFTQIFDLWKSRLALKIINFNYTHTVNEYVDKQKVINIHGVAGNKHNPIVFGYSAKDFEISEYRKIDNEFERYIKDSMYSDADSYYDFTQVLSGIGEKTRVIILGHSCGLSDTAILEKIFNDDRVEYIEIVYFDDNSWQNQKTEIRRLLKDVNNNNKLVAKTKSIMMPQHNSDNLFQMKIDTYKCIIEKYWPNVNLDNIMGHSAG